MRLRPFWMSGVPDEAPPSRVAAAADGREDFPSTERDLPLCRGNRAPVRAAMADEGVNAALLAGLAGRELLADAHQGLVPFFGEPISRA